MEVPIGFSACLSYPWNVADVSIRFLQRQRSRGPHESIIASFEKLLPPFPLRPVKRRFSARRAATRLEFARVIPSAKPPTGPTTKLFSQPRARVQRTSTTLIRVAELVSPYTMDRIIAILQSIHHMFFFLPSPKSKRVKYNCHSGEKSSWKIITYLRARSS